MESSYVGANLQQGLANSQIFWFFQYHKQNVRKNKNPSFKWIDLL
jgi:hypothetical protein